MAIKIALAGNPNCGKTTLFNNLTGANQYVGNWPGVTVEKKEGRLKGAPEVIIQDLPGIYSLSPYTLEEVVARGYLVRERPDVILNIVDATNIERNLYLTTQLAELGIPMVIALNMIDLSRKAGDRIDVKKLGEALGCEAVELSALRGDGCAEAAQRAAALAGKADKARPDVFTGAAQSAIARMEALLAQSGAIADNRLARWYAAKLFERDEKAAAELTLSPDAQDAAERLIAACEKEADDDAESIVTGQRYAFISRVVGACVRRGKPRGALSASDKIDRFVTNRFIALPLFAAVMFLVYYVSVTTVGTIVTDFTNDVFVGEWIQAPVMDWLTAIGTADWLVSLIGEGVIAGVGAVIGFVPQMLVLFFFLAILEDVGYMSRVAFIMDRIFRRFGLSGKSFIPMLISSGCGVPGIMASRTIENDRDRKMTIMTATFIPCGAKMPIVALIAGALFHNAGWVAAAAYFIGVAAVIFSGVLLKKTRLFAGDPAPFVMELPAYHAPAWKNVLRSMGERGGSFVKRAGTVILLSSMLIWLTSNYGFIKARPAMDEGAQTAQAEQAAQSKPAFGRVENADDSLLGVIGAAVSPVFKPLGFGAWQPTVATVMGLAAKEEVVNVFGVLYSVTDADGQSAAQDILDDGELTDAEKESALSPIAQSFDAMSGGHGRLAAFAFLLFNLLCAPCFAAMGAIKREMNSAKWTAFAILYQCALAYAVALCVYQFGLLFAGAGITLGTLAALLILAGALLLLLRKNPYDSQHLLIKGKAVQ